MVSICDEWALTLTFFFQISVEAANRRAKAAKRPMNDMDAFVHIQEHASQLLVCKTKAEMMHVVRGHIATYEDEECGTLFFF